MPYNVELCYGYFEGECGIYHAFRLVAPEKDFPDDVEKSLAESLETKADNPNFIWDCMHLNLPDAVVERIKADGVREYLYKKTCGTQNSPHAFAQDGRDLFKRGIRLSRKQKSAQRSERPLDAMQHGN